MARRGGETKEFNANIVGDFIDDKGDNDDNREKMTKNSLFTHKEI